MNIGRGARTPNIVVVLIDTLRADHLSCHGYGRQTSPWIDRIGPPTRIFELDTVIRKRLEDLGYLS